MWHWYHQWVLKKRKQTNGKPKRNTASSSCWVIHGIMGDLMRISSTFRTWELSSHLKIGGCREAHSNLDCIPVERMRLESLWPGKAGNNTGSPYSAQCDGQHSLLPFQLLPASCLSLECVYLWVCVDIWPPVIKLNVDITVGNEPQDPGPGQRNTDPRSFCCTDSIICLSGIKEIVLPKMIIMSCCSKWLYSVEQIYINLVLSND